MNERWRGLDQEALDREYNARETVPDFDAEMRRYQECSAHARGALNVIRDLPYDPEGTNTLDWFVGREGAPVLLWIHGGYWRALSKEDNSCVAPGLVAAGIHVAVMDYSLAPGVTMDVIVEQVRRAHAWVAANAVVQGADPTRVYVGGSSAGAHLAATLLTGKATVEGGVQGAICLSGLYDLEPIRLSYVNEAVRLDAAVARQFSPLHHIPKPPAPRLLASYGSLETGEFKRQTEDYAAAYAAAGNEASVVPQPGLHHFDIVLALGTAGHPLCQAATAFMGE